MGKVKEINITELAVQAHENAVRHGFWEQEYSDLHCLCLVVSELMEAVEAHRKGERADMVGFKTCMDNAYKGEVRPDWLEHSYTACIKGSIEEELADAAIRLLDLAGARGCNLTSGERAARTVVVNTDSSFTENVFGIVCWIAEYDGKLAGLINSTIVQLQNLCGILGFDLWQHVQLKMQYNTNRSYKHGKQY